MAKYVYLFRNLDLYIIGQTNNIEREKNILKPAKPEAIAIQTGTDELIKLLHNKYSNSRLPKSDYFRLSKSEARECIVALKSDDVTNKIKPFFQGQRLVLAFLIAWIVISFLIIKLAINPFISII